MSAPAAPASDTSRLGILFILLGMALISVNDMLIKKLSGGYPLHEMIFVRSAIGICFSFVFLQMEGGFTLLRTRRPGLHLLRAGLVVFSNMIYFAALAVMPLATATALFFVAPLCITLLSIPILGEAVGPRRITAVVIGLFGVVVMMAPGIASGAMNWSMVLPVIAAAAYAGMQILTRKLGVASRASAMAIYIQGTFLMVSIGFYLVAGDGRFAEGARNESLVFLLREWVFPAPGDMWLFLLLGATSAGIGYSLSQAYRLGEAATIAPFEYAALPLAVMWGWLIWGEFPTANVWAGIALIAGSGLYVFRRERVRHAPLRGSRPVRRY